MSESFPDETTTIVQVDFPRKKLYSPRVWKPYFHEFKNYFRDLVLFFLRLNFLFRRVEKCSNPRKLHFEDKIVDLEFVREKEKKRKIIFVACRRRSVEGAHFCLIRFDLR